MSLAELIGQVLAVVIVSLFHAILARLFVRLFVRATVPYATAYLIVLVSNMAQFTLAFVVIYIVAKTGGSVDAARLPLALVAFAVGGFVLGLLPKGPDGQNIGPGYGLLVQGCSAALVIGSIVLLIWLMKLFQIH